MKNQYSVPFKQWCLIALGAMGWVLSARAQPVQPPTIQWQAIVELTYSNTASQGQVQAVKASNGGYAVLTADIGTLVRLSANGDVIWKKRIPTRLDGDFTSIYEATGLAATSDGGFGILAREFYGWDLIRVDANGNRVWIKELDNLTPGSTNTPSYRRNLISTSDGGFLEVGVASGLRSPNSFICNRYNQNGDRVWSGGGRYSEGTQQNEIFYSTSANRAIETNDGGFIVVGTVAPYRIDARGFGWAAKVNNQGQIIWQKLYDYVSTFTGVIPTPYGPEGYIAVGLNANGAGTSTLFINPTGNADNTSGTFRTTNLRAGFDKAPGIVNTGNTSHEVFDITDQNNGDFRLVSYTSANETRWIKTLGGSGLDDARSIVATDDGGYLVAGVTTSTDGDVQGKPRNNLATWIVKLSPATPTNTLTLTQPTYNCQTGAITFNTSGGDGSPITYTAPGISRATATDNFGTVEQGLRNDPKPIAITASQSGQTVSYVFDLELSSLNCAYGFKPPIQVKPIPDLTFTVGQIVGNSDFTLNDYFVDPSNKPPHYFSNWAASLKGLPNGLFQYTANGGDLRTTLDVYLQGSPIITGVYTVTVTVSLFRFLDQPLTTTFKINVTDASVVNPPTGGTLTLTQPTYNCQTGAITFNTTGGNGSPIIFTAPGITRANLADNFGTVEQGLRNDPKPIAITASQSRQTVSYTFDFGAYCRTLPGGSLTLLAPTVNCESLNATLIINSAGGDGSPITYSVPGATLSSPASNTAFVFQCINAANPSVLIQATQRGYTAAYSLDLYKACPTTQFGQPFITRQIPDLTLSVGQTLQEYNVSPYFTDPNRFLKYNLVAAYSSSAQGMPTGINYSLLGTNSTNGLVAKFSGMAPSRAGVYTVTITAATIYCDPVMSSFNIIVIDQSAGSGLTLTQPTYNCQTGAIMFNTTGGNGSPIEYRAVGITDWTTNPNQFVDTDSRTANDVQPFTLMARQNGQTVSLTWNLKAACGRANSRLQAAETNNPLKLTVLGNPVQEQLRVMIQGVDGQPVTLRLTDLTGRLVESRTVLPTDAAQEHVFELNRHEAGLLLLRASSGTRQHTIKVLKQ